MSLHLKSHMLKSNTHVNISFQSPEPRMVAYYKLAWSEASMLQYAGDILWRCIYWWWSGLWFINMVYFIEERTIVTFIWKLHSKYHYTATLNSNDHDLYKKSRTHFHYKKLPFQKTSSREYLLSQINSALLWHALPSQF